MRKNWKRCLALLFALLLMIMPVSDAIRAYAADDVSIVETEEPEVEESEVTEEENEEPEIEEAEVTEEKPEEPEAEEPETEEEKEQLFDESSVEIISETTECIKSLETYYQDGDAVLEDNQYVLNPEHNYAYNQIGADKRYSITYGVHFSLSGKDSYAPGTVKLRIPAQIFKGRDGTYTANFSTMMPVPEDGEENSTDYSYTYDADTKEYVITNIHTLTSACEATFNVKYILFYPSLIENGAFTRDYDVKLAVDKENVETEEKTASAGNVRIDTRAELESTKKTVYQKYESYPDDWGTPDENSDDYFYVAYKILTRVPNTNTQPSVLKVEDIPIGSNGEVVGYRTGQDYSWSDNSTSLNTPAHNFSTQPPEFVIDVPDCQWSNYYSTFVLVRYQRSALNPDDPGSYQLQNKAVATITGEDGQGSSSLESQIVYKYTPPDGFKIPRDYGYVYKSGSGTTYGAVAMLESDNDVSLSGNYTNWTIASTYSRTYQEPEGLTTEEEKEQAKLDSANYGKRKVRTELVDDLFYFQDHYDAPLTEEDYELTYVQLNTNSNKVIFQKYEKNRETGNYQTVNLSGTEIPDMQLWIKTAGEGWKQYGTYHADQYSRFSFTYEDGTTLPNSNPRITLPEKTVGIKLVTENTCYSSAMAYDVYLKLKATEHIKNLIEKTTPGTVSVDGRFVDRYQIMNVNSLLLYDEDGQLFTFSTPTDSKLEHAYERDQQLYGMKVSHATATQSISDFPRNSRMSKSAVSYENDTSSKTVRIHYQLKAMEELRYSAKTYTAEQLGNMGVLKEQRTGTFYDLLPKGCIFDASTLQVTSYTPGKNDSNYKKYVAAMDEYQVSYTYELMENWRNTGRTMVVIHMRTPDGVRTYPYKDGFNYASFSSFYSLYTGFLVTFDVSYSWDAVADYGVSLLNSAAYRSEDGNLSYGLPDTGGAITEAELFRDLDGDDNPEGTSADYLYAEAKTKLDVVTATELALSKRVRAEHGEWTDGLDGSVILDAGENYEYRLRIGSAKNTQTKDMIFYDALEQYHPENGGAQWRGILTGVDTSQPEMKGIQPVIYYSTSEVFQNPSNLESGEYRDLTNEDLWTTICPDDPAEITAVAVDLRKTDKGEEYVLPEQQTLSVILKMKVPDDVTKEALAEAHAYNNIYLSNILIDTQNTETSFVIHAEYTQVGLKTIDNAYELPNTGGRGPIPYYLFGTMLIISACVLQKKMFS